LSAQLLHFGKRLYRSPEQKVPRSNRAITSQSALGALVRVGFAGSVTSFSGEIQTVGEPIPVSPADAEAALGGSIHVGTPFSGFFVYDDSAAPSYSSPELPGIPGYPESGFAQYFFLPSAGPYFAAGGEIGSFAGSGDTAHASSGEAETTDNEVYLTGARSTTLFITGGVTDSLAPPGEIALDAVELYLVGTGPGSPLHGTSLHSIPWDLGSFPQPEGVFAFIQGSLSIQVDGVVTRLPEPTGIGLVALASLALLSVTVPEPALSAVAVLGAIALALRPRRSW